LSLFQYISVSIIIYRVSFKSNKKIKTNTME